MIGLEKPRRQRGRTKIDGAAFSDYADLLHEIYVKEMGVSELRMEIKNEIIDLIRVFKEKITNLVRENKIPKTALDRLKKFENLRLYEANLQDGMSAAYSLRMNSIVLSKKFIEEYYDKRISKVYSSLVIMHEFFHVIGGSSDLFLKEDLLVSYTKDGLKTEHGEWINEAIVEYFLKKYFGTAPSNAYQKNVKRLEEILSDKERSSGIDETILWNAYFESWSSDGDKKTNISKTWFRKLVDEINRVIYERESGVIIKPKNVATNWEMNAEQKKIVGGNFGWLKLLREFNEIESPKAQNIGRENFKSTSTDKSTETKTEEKKWIEVDENMPLSKIKTLYRNVISKLHPDSNNGDTSNQPVLAKFITAYKVLIDQELSDSNLTSEIITLVGDKNRTYSFVPVDAHHAFEFILNFFLNDWDFNKKPVVVEKPKEQKQRFWGWGYSKFFFEHAERVVREGFRHSYSETKKQELDNTFAQIRKRFKLHLKGINLEDLGEFDKYNFLDSFVNFDGETADDLPKDWVLMGATVILQLSSDNKIICKIIPEKRSPSFVTRFTNYLKGVSSFPLKEGQFKVSRVNSIFARAYVSEMVERRNCTIQEIHDNYEDFSKITKISPISILKNTSTPDEIKTLLKIKIMNMGVDYIKGNTIEIYECEKKEEGFSAGDLVLKCVNKKTGKTHKESVFQENKFTV